MNRIAALGCVVNLSVNFALIPRMGAIGGAWATFATQWVVASLFVFYAARKAHLVTAPQWIAKLALFLGLCLATGWGMSLVDIPWTWKLASISIVGIPGLFLLRLVSVSAVKSLFQR
jgi:O-antigen/teichoic acid export membrane protein